MPIANSPDSDPAQWLARRALWLFAALALLVAAFALFDTVLSGGDIRSTGEIRRPH